MKLQCWCGNADLLPFSAQYERCPICETLITAQMPVPEFTEVKDDERDFYGREYWFSHQEQDLGFTNITRRARIDLPERTLHWLHRTLKRKLPPGRALELGCAHGAFVASLKWSGFDASGLELSPWVVNYAHETFDIPMLLGPVEEQPLEPGSLDIVALMDVLEHLPNPVSTMRHCLNLLNPAGILIIQTPRYPEGMAYEEMVAQNDAFLDQLRANQHLYLFSQTSIREMFRRLGAEHMEFEPAIFAHYDMFLIVSRSPLATNAADVIADALTATPQGRMVLALLDLDDQFAHFKQQHADLKYQEALLKHQKTVLERQNTDLKQQHADLKQQHADLKQQHTDMQQKYTVAEADRAARLEVIQRQGAQLGRIPALEAEVSHLREQLAASEADRAARLEVIQAQGAQIDGLRHSMQETSGLLQQVHIQTRLGMALPSDVRRMNHAVAQAHRRLETRLGGNKGAGTTDASAAAVPVPAKPPAAERPADANGKHAEARVADPIEQIRDPKTTRPLNYTPAIVGTIIRNMRAQGFSVEELTLDPAEYHAYFAAAGYPERYPKYYTFNLPEKSLEHFIAAKLLELGSDDVYIDIASEHSPVPDIYTRLFGCASYRQDLAYPEGLHGDRIGGDAAAMPVSDGFATKMALHCSFEHFERDSDMRFTREAERVLRSAGRVCFAPLYLFHEYAILTDPVIAVAEQVPFEDDAVVYCRPGWQNRHGRLYDAPHLESRVGRNLGTMHLTIYHITNAKEIDPSCYIQFAAIITKP